MEGGAVSGKTEYIWVLLTFSVIWSVASTLLLLPSQHRRQQECNCTCPR